MDNVSRLPDKDKKQNRIGVEGVNRQHSRKEGVWGVIENLARHFQTVAFVLFIVPLIGFYALALSAALFPGIYLLVNIWRFFAEDSILNLSLALAAGAGVGVIGFIAGIMISVAVLNYPFIRLVKVHRGPWFSLDSLPWLYHNALFYLVRYTVLDFVTPTPLSQWFLKAMGMKIGAHSMINTSNISDPCLIELGDHVTVGGSTYMMAHYGMNGFLIIDKLIIQRKANIGLHCLLMGAVEIGEAAQILPNSIVLPKTKIAPNQRFSNYPLETQDKSGQSQEDHKKVSSS